MQFSSGERTLLNYCSTLVNLPQFVNEQAIGLKLTIHLLKAKGFLNSEIAEVFNLMSTKDKRRWNDGTITFIAEKELTNKKLGTHCRPKEQIKVT